MKNNKSDSKDTKKKTKHVKNLARTSYYTHGSSYDPETEIGTEGAYGAQGERDENNTYTRS
jgi:hypothetical protein